MLAIGFLQDQSRVLRRMCNYLANSALIPAARFDGIGTFRSDWLEIGLFDGRFVPILANRVLLAGGWSGR